MKFFCHLLSIHAASHFEQLIDAINDNLRVMNVHKQKKLLNVLSKLEMTIIFL